MVLRVGVAGSRYLPEDAEKQERLKQKLREFYAQLDSIFLEIGATPAAQKLYSNVRGNNRIRFISSLAEGIDRLAVDADVLEIEHELAAILPFQVEEYEQDFLPKNSVSNKETGTVGVFRDILDSLGYGKPQAPLIELDGDPGNREAAYLYCSKVHVEHCDLLVAVYDTAEQGMKGTAATVAYAKAAGLPVVAMDINDPDNLILHPSSRFGITAATEPFSEASLRRELHRLLLFTDVLTSSAADDEDSILTHIDDYRDEADKLEYAESSLDYAGDGPLQLKAKAGSRLSSFFDIFKRTLSAHKGKHGNGESVLPQAEETNEFRDEDLKHRTAAHGFYSAFLRADRLANHYSRIHRSGFLMIYLAGALALIAAATGLLASNYTFLVSVLVVLELFLLLFILVTYLRDRDSKQSDFPFMKWLAKGYHSRWLEYRHLAESIRPLIYLSPLGRSFPIVEFHSDQAYQHSAITGPSKSVSAWVGLHTQQLVRYIGFNHCKLDVNYKTKVLKFLRESWLLDQREYHRSNSHNMELISERLEVFGVSCFFITMAALFLKLLVLFVLDPGHTSALWTPVASAAAFLAIVLPVCAATSIAISNHAEFAISTKRSRIMVAFLEEYIVDLRNAEPTISSQALYTRIDAIARKSMREVSSWLEIYEEKKSELA